MNWFGSNTIDQTQLKNSDFDMILKLKNKRGSGSDLVNLELMDATNQTFYIQYTDQNAFNIGDYLKIRSISRMY